MTPLEENKLTIELLKRLFGNFGFVPGAKDGIVGIPISDKTIKVKQDKNIIQKHLFIGKLNNYEITVIIENFGDIENKSLVGLIQLSEQVMGLILEWNDKSDSVGDILFLAENDWFSAPIRNQLALAHFIEVATDAGYLWEKQEPTEEQIKLFNNLTEM